jgi:hypothetical protein
MKPSKRNQDRAAKQAARKQAEKPSASKYAAKGGPYRYDYQDARRLGWQDR